MEFSLGRHTREVIYEKINLGGKIKMISRINVSGFALKT